MDGLSRQSSRVVEVEAYLTQVIGLPAKSAKEYTSGLVEELSALELPSPASNLLLNSPCNAR